MPIEVLDAVLPLSVNCLVQFFPNLSACQLSYLTMRFHISYPHGEHLSSPSKRRRSIAPWRRANEHDVGISQIHLNSTQRLSIAVLLGKPKNSTKPLSSLGHAAINKMRKQT